MNKLIFILFVFPAFAFGQKVQYTTFIPVENIPADFLPKKVKEVGFLYNEYATDFAWGYPLTDNKYKVIKKIDFNPFEILSGDTYAYYENDTIIFYSRVPWKATMFNYHFTWNKKQLIFHYFNVYDPSEEAITLAEAALKTGDISEAVLQYESVFYPSSYLDMSMGSIGILSAANQWGLKAAAENRFTDASGYMSAALNYYFISDLTNQLVVNFEIPYDDYLTDHGLEDVKDSIGVWLTNHAHFLYRADSLEDCISFCIYLVSVYPDLAPPHLFLGDALFKDNNPTEAKHSYLEYIAIMKEQGKEKEIPQRVLDRVK